MPEIVDSFSLEQLLSEDAGLNGGESGIIFSGIPSLGSVFKKEEAVNFIGMVTGFLTSVFLLVSEFFTIISGTDERIFFIGMRSVLPRIHGG